MSIFPEFQPIIFEPYLPDSCNCNDATFRLLAKPSDVAQFQVVIAPCSGSENILCNPSLSSAEFTCSNWDVTGGFSLDDGACCEEAIGTLTQFDALIVGSIYQFEVNILSLTGTLYVYNGGTLVASLTALGVNTFTFAAVSQDISFAIEDTAHSVCITTIAARYISQNMSFGIINSSGATVGVFSYADNPTYFTFTKDRATIKFTWSDFGVQEGQCYTIGFADGCTNTNGQLGIFNGGFDSCLNGWTVNPGTIPSITCESLENPETGEVENCIEFDNTGTGNITNDITTLKIGLSYEVTVGAMSDDADGVLRVYCGTNYADFATAGTQTVVCAGNTTFKVEAILNTATYIRVWDVTVALTNLTDTEFEYESYAFKIDQNACTHMINLSNDDDGMGFVFEGSSFAPQIRLESELLNSVTEHIRETYHDNLGTKRVFYGEYRKRFVFNIDYVPAWVIDFIALCFIADHFFIDGVEYFIENDQLEPQYPEQVCYSNMASLQLEVSIKTQMKRNTDLGNSEQLISFGTQQVWTDSNGETVTDYYGSAIDVIL